MTFKKLKNNKAQTIRIKWKSILIKMSQKVSSNNTRMKQKGKKLKQTILKPV